MTGLPQEMPSHRFGGRRPPRQHRACRDGRQCRPEGPGRPSKAPPAPAELPPRSKRQSRTVKFRCPRRSGRQASRHVVWSWAAADANPSRHHAFRQLPAAYPPINRGHDAQNPPQASIRRFIGKESASSANSGPRGAACTGISKKRRLAKATRRQSRDVSNKGEAAAAQEEARARARCRATLARFPQVRISHQRRRPAGERSTKSQRQVSSAQTRRRWRSWSAR